MIIKCKDIAGFIEGFAPLNIAEEWDNVGLLLGSLNNDVGRVMVCLDATTETIDEAISKNANLIITHHPFIFKGLKRISIDDYLGKNISKLIKNGISIYSAHTNLDMAVGGVNQCLAEAIGISDLRDIKEFGLGKIGVLKDCVSLENFISLVKSKLNTSTVRLIGNLNKEIKKVAVFCGSFDESMISLIKNQADILVTGDIKYHTSLDLVENGICTIDAGHFNTEFIIVSHLIRLLQDKFLSVEFFGSGVEKDPFKFI